MWPWTSRLDFPTRCHANVTDIGARLLVSRELEDGYAGVVPNGVGKLVSVLSERA